MLNAENEPRFRRFRDALEAGEPWPIEQCLEEVDAESRLSCLIQYIHIELEHAYVRTTRKLHDDDDDARVQPRLELYLGRFPELRADLHACKVLASLEFALHYASRDPIPAEHYQEVIPEHAVQIVPMLQTLEKRLNKTVLQPNQFEPTKPKNDTVADSTSEPLPQWKLPKVLGFFHLLSLVGSGGMGSVFRALDLRTGGLCAVKVMRRTDPWSIYRFNEEFHVLASLDHPNLGSLYESFDDGFNRYFSMELVAGPGLDRWWARLPKNRDGLEHLRTCLHGIVHGIQFLHDHRIIHGDIKPSNVVVARRARAVLLDFGLSQSETPRVTKELLRDRPLVGTLGYTAPELGQGLPLSFASDWFGFGALLYDLTQYVEPNVLPHLEDSSLEEWTEFNRHIQSLSRALMHQDPSLRPSGEEVLTRLGGSNRSLRHGAPLPSELPWFGRARLWDQVDHWLNLDQAARGGVLRCLGAAGVGKSRFLKELGARWQAEEQAIVLAVRGLRPSQTPQQFVNSLVQAFVNLALHSEIDLANETPDLQRVAIHFQQLFQVLPPLEATAPAHDTRPTWQQSAQTFFRILSRIGAHRPIVILVDDAHCVTSLQECGLWETSSPKETRQKLLPNLRLVLALNHPSQASPLPARSQFAEDLPWLDLELGTMPEEDMRPLVQEALLRLELPTPLAERDWIGPILASAKGIPAVAMELLRLIEEHSGSPEELHTLLQRVQAMDIAHVRFTRLSRESRQLLELLAVAMQPITFRQLQMAAKVGADILFPHVGGLVRRGWIRWSGSWPDLLIEPFGHASPEQIAQWMAPDRFRRRHHRLGKTLSSEMHPNWLLIGKHYFFAGRKSRAIAALQQAIEDLRKQNAPEAAIAEAQEYLARLHL